MGGNQVIRTLLGHKSPIQCVEFHPFGEFFASAADTTVKLWDLRRKGCIQTYAEHTSSVNGLSITPDGRWIACVEHDQVKIWDMTAGKPIDSVSMPGLKGAMFSPTELVMAVYSASGEIELVDLETFQVMSRLKTGGTLSHVLFAEDGGMLHAAYHDRLDTFDVDTLTVQQSVAAGWGTLEDMVVVKGEEKVVAAGIHQSSISLWGCHLKVSLSFRSDSKKGMSRRKTHVKGCMVVQCRTEGIR